MNWQKKYIKKYYSPEKGWIDGTTQFHNLCRGFISETSKVLEFGAGPSNKTSQFLSGISAELVGLDVDLEVKENKFLSAAFTYDGSFFPFDAGTFDIVVSNYVMEHVAQPLLICKEISRVLKPGGVFIFRTPNFFHYVPILSYFFPMGLANWVRNLPDDAHDPYPTVYKFNSETKCREILNAAGFEIIELHLVEKEPSYGMKSRLLFFPMMAYERMVNATEKLRQFRVNIFCAAGKK
ncbi:SAM-dependent methyltransferase [Desulfonema limicola]|uniref:SAM-dependent methyltransferase n=1 Tax=Desulfonema limicola TaxID=45656 RepID=A0A975B5J6_9BACT|nr:class I SAM-dependent methyltransferase [Desulfonema limicola]QTA79208.1 SAM-dependent methyltransferase [Desulfonema limicola]